MPPPAPYNLNRWIVIGSVAMIVSGYFAAKRSKPALEFEKAGPDPVAKQTVDAVPETAGEPLTDEARYRACLAALDVPDESQYQRALARLKLRLAMPPEQRLSYAAAAAECEKIAAAFDAGVAPPP